MRATTFTKLMMDVASWNDTLNGIGTTPDGEGTEIIPY